jgi:heme exporter protein A
MLSSAHDDGVRELMGGFTGHGLAAARGGRRLFEGLDFALPPGGALVLVGPNGSGKSSLLRLMAGFGKPAAGVIAWSGEDIQDDVDAYRGRIHLLGHADAVKPALRVGELLGFWAAVAGAEPNPSRLTVALSAMGLSHLAETPCRFLSAGQRRRLALARLVAYPRPLWLLDEPSVGLDAASLGALATMIAAHRREGGIVVLSTHQDMGLGDAVVLKLDDHPPAATGDADWWTA